MNIFINSLYILLDILPIMSLFIGTFLCFLGYKIIKVFNIILGAIIGSLIGFMVGIIIFNSSFMGCILGIMLSITFIFFSFVYHKYLKDIYIVILNIIWLLYLSYFILLPVPIYVYFVTSLLVLVLNYKYVYPTTVIITSFVGATMILSDISFIKNIFIKIIFIIILAFLGGLLQSYLSKVKEKKRI